MSFVRVRLENGHEVSMSETHARTSGLEVLDQPATDLRGKPLPASRKHGRRIKPKTTVKKAAAAKKTAAAATEVAPE